MQCQYRIILQNIILLILLMIAIDLVANGIPVNLLKTRMKISSFKRVFKRGKVIKIYEKES